MIVHQYSCVGTYSGHSGPVWALAVSDQVVFSGSEDHRIKVRLGTPTRQCLPPLSWFF